MTQKYSSSQQLFSEFFGSLILVFTAISPVILGYNVLGSSVAVAVLMDAIAVGLVLFVLIETLGPISGCHINPAVTIAMLVTKKNRDEDRHFIHFRPVCGRFFGCSCQPCNVHRK